LAAKKGRLTETRAARRREKLAEIQRQQKRKERLRNALTGGAVAAAVIAIIVPAIIVSQRSRAESDRASTALASDVQTYTVTAGHEIGELEYEQTPPAGGNHNPVWLNCGIYDVPVPSENAVHSMEHGAAWVTYRPDLAASEVDELRAAMPSSYAILSPFPDLPSPVVASAWRRQLMLDSADDPRLEAFLREYVQGPQAPEPGASCSGGSDGSLPLDLSGGMVQR